MQIRAAFEEDRAGRIVLEYLLQRCAEMVVEGSPFPYPDMLTAFLVELIYLRLEDHRDGLHEEDSA